MFLLNSQAPLGTATCGPGGLPPGRRHPFSRSYGANLPSSLARVSPQTPVGFSPRGTSVGSRYGRGGSFPAPFSRAPGIGGRGLTAPHSRLRPVLAVTALPGLQRLAGSPPFGGPRSAYPEASEAGLALPHLPPRYGNVNPFPFPGVRVTAPVRTDSPSADDRCRGTLALSGGGDSHPSSLLLPPGSAPGAAPADLTARLLRRPGARLPDEARIAGLPRGLGGRLEPRHIFGALGLGG